MTTARRSAAVLALLCMSTPGYAQSLFESPRSLLIETECRATRSIKGDSDPTALEVGASYPALGLNRADGATHVLIEVGGAKKWAALSCGRFADGQGPAASTPSPDGPQGSRASESCLPFFDDADNPVQTKTGLADLTPVAPELTTFDTSVVAVCGAPGTSVTDADLVGLFAAHPDVVQRLRTFTGGRVFAAGEPPANNQAFIADLVRAWQAAHAFDHVFCGEPNAGPSGGKIGGLHFHGRYLALQLSGDACRMNNPRDSEVQAGAIYTMGVEMKNASGRIVKDGRKGFGLTLSAEDILKLGTRALAENSTDSDESTACLLDVKDDGKAFKTVFVRRSAGIRTIYPDATPNGRGDRINPPCAKPISLQP